LKTLERRLGLTSVVAISMGAMLGSGLFVLPGLATGMTGPSVWLAYLVAGLLVLPAALSKAELGTAMPTSGGTYVYIDRAFGPFAGTIAGLGLWLSLLLKSAFALVGFGAYLTVIVDIPLVPTALALLVVVTGLNVVGVRKVGRVQIAVVVLSIIGLGTLAIWGSFSFRSDYLTPAFTDGTTGFIATVAFVYISFAGVTKVAAIAEEVSNPNRNLPLGILLSLGLVTVLYVAITLVLVANVPAAELGDDLHPIYTLAERIAGPTMGLLAAILGVITMTSMANAGILASSRFPFAMSRDRLLPQPLSWVEPRFMTPIASIVATAAVMAVAILLFDVAKIAKIAGSFMIAAFVAENATVMWLRESDAQWYKPAFRTPFYPWVQIAGIIGGLGLLGMMGLLALYAMGAMTLLGTLLYVAYGRRRADRVGLYGRLGPRQDLIAELDPTGHDLRAALPGEAEVVVALLGEERSPEALVEMGGALAIGGKVEVVHLTDVPDQTALEGVDDDPTIESLERRVEALGDERGFDIEFDAAVTHDVLRTVHEVTNRVHCQWLVMEWHGEKSSGISLFNPLGSMINHLTANLAFFKDVGIRYFREILVVPEPGPNDVLVATTADHLATTLGARLTFVRYVPEPASNVTKTATLTYLAQLGDLCESKPELLLVHGQEHAKAIAELTVSYDLVVIGDRPGTNLRERFFGNEVERITEKASCSVIRLKTPRTITNDSVPPPPIAEGEAASDAAVDDDAVD